MTNKAKIIQELAQNNIINSSAFVTNQYKGSTESIILEVRDKNKKIAVKLEKPHITLKATSFLNTYKNINLLPRLLYTAKDKSFFAYDFLENELFGKKELDKETVELIIDQVINKYTYAQDSFWGNFEWPKKTIEEFLLEEINWRKNALDKILGKKEGAKINSYAKKIFSKFKQKPYLVHGDLGVHNIIVKNNQISGVIDPFVNNSLPALEYFYFICSKPHSLSIKDVLELFKKLKNKTQIKEDYLPYLYWIKLYVRIGTCSKYHPDDLEKYIEIYRKL